MKAILRSIQTFFPFLHDARYRFQAQLMKWRKKPVEEDYTLFQYFTPQPQEHFVDIGANRGETILSMQLYQQFKNPIVAFEPNSILFEKFKTRGFTANPRLKIHNCGLSNKDGELKLFIPFYRQWMFDGLSSFHYEEAAGWLRERMWNFKEKNLSVKEMICPVKTLDSFNLDPYFMKIDVQGHELQVLQGAEETLKKHHPILLIEALDQNIADYLASFGYKFFVFEEGILKPGFGGLNTYCIPDSKRGKLPFSD